MKRDLDNGPWYRQPWPWILMLGPFVVVIAAIVTAWIAWSTSDGLVTEDYYKKGLVANQTILRSDRATQLGLVAALRFTAERVSVRLSAKDAGFAPPAALQVTISHPTRAGLDQSRMLINDGQSYAGDFHLPASGHWLVLLEDDKKTWRLLGNVILPAAGDTVIGGTVAPTPADIRR